MSRYGLLLSYLGLVGIPLVSLLAILHAGAHLTPPISVAGAWSLNGDFSQVVAGSPCGELLGGLKQPALDIKQAGSELTLTLNNPREDFD